MPVKARLFYRQVVLAGLLILSLLTQGCSHFRFNALMCDAIEPGQTIPPECYPYTEEEAAKASLPEQEQELECPECSRPEKLEYKH